MSWIDVDVIAKTQNKEGGVEDRRLKFFRVELEKENALAKTFKVSSSKLLVKDVDNIEDMVTRILSGIGNRRIRRLRIFGHGMSGVVWMGPESKFPETNRKRKIYVQLAPGSRYQLSSRKSLEKLKGHFEPSAWVELHACQVMKLHLGNVTGGDWDPVLDGKKLIEALSNVWDRLILASDAPQIRGGGLEGNIWQARPGKKAEKVRVHQPQSSGLTPTSQTLLAGNNPLRKALDSLKPASTVGTRPTQGTGQALVFTYDPTKVGSFAGQSQMSITKKLITQHAVNPSLRALNARNNPIRAAIAGLRGPSAVVPLSKMPPGTTYSNINTGRTFRVNALGMHIDTGMNKGFTSKHESNLALRILHAHHDPLRNAFDSLKPRSSTISPMPTGTTYSILSTRKSYEVDAFGRHIQTGSQQGLATRYGIGTTARNFQAWQNPLREAVRKLGQ